MKINLIRNLETARNKEQEDSFENTMNFALYFTINKSISKIDGWKLSNVKNLVKQIEKENITVDIEYSKWEENTDYILTNAKPNLIQKYKLDENIQNSIRNCALTAIHKYLVEIKEDKNLKLEFLLGVANEIKNNNEAILIINQFINNGISTIDLAIDCILPLLIKEKQNE